ncbi:MAG: YfhO family protein, partial [Bacteroidota bacterium]|nr:YfhO family protein [Bacteroidota bacterium]
KSIPLQKTTAVFGALAFTFSGFMMGGAGWYLHSIHWVYVALLLFGFEQALIKKRFVVFFIVLLVFIRGMNPFYIYVFGLFLIVYSLMRTFSREMSIKDVGRFYLKTAGITAAAFLVNLPFLLSKIESILSDPRVSGNLSKSEQMQSISVFATGDFLHNVTALLRFFSNDILGTGQISERIVNGQRLLVSDFKGYYNYYEAPMFYIGLLTLLIFPQAFRYGTKREKIIYAGFIIVWAIPVLFPYFRRAYFLFFGDYYRAFSFFLPFAVLYSAVISFNRILKENKLNLYLLWITAALLLVFLNIPYFSAERLQELRLNSNPVDASLKLILSLVIIIETLILTSFVKYLNYKRYMLPLLGLVFVFELLFTANITLNHRDTLSVDEFESHSGYNDNTVDAVEYLQERDSSFYRTEKDYASGWAVHGSLNDAKVQGYFGTTSYASNQNPYYVRFMQELEVIPTGDETAARWSAGVRSRPLLAVMCNVKYMLSRNEEPYFLQTGYKKLAETGDVDIYKNGYSLPLGYSYAKYISEAEFKESEGIQKDISLLKAVVLPDSVAANLPDTAEYKPKPEPGYSVNDLKLDVEALSQESLIIHKFRQDEIKGEIELSQPKILFFSILYDSAWQIKINDKEAKSFNANIGFTGLYLPAGKHSVEMIYPPRKSPKYAGLSNVLFLILVFGGIVFAIYTEFFKTKNVSYTLNG